MSTSPRIRVAHLVMTLNIGGLERVVLDLVRHASADRFECFVICLEEAGALAGEFAAAGVPVETVGSAASGPLGNISALRRRLRTLRPHVLHTHNVKPHVQGTLSAVLAGVPVVVSTKHGQHHASGLAGIASRWASRRCRSLVGVSADAARIWCDVEKAPESSVRVVYNGIDLTCFGPPPERTADTLRRAVTVARLSDVKDQQTLLHAVRAVVDREPRFTLDIVGDGPCRADLEALRARLQLEAHVRFHGFRTDIVDWLASSGMFLLSSRSEGVPLTMLEAMASGLPVVSTNVGGIPEVVVAGRTGVLVPAGRPEALAAAILDLIGSPELAFEMGTAGRARVERMFDVRSMSRQYEALYLDGLRLRGLAANPGAPPRPTRIAVANGKEGARV